MTIDLLALGAQSLLPRAFIESWMKRTKATANPVEAAREANRLRTKRRFNLWRVTVIWGLVEFGFLGLIFYWMVMAGDSFHSRPGLGLIELILLFGILAYWIIFGVFPLGREEECENMMLRFTYDFGWVLNQIGKKPEEVAHYTMSDYNALMREVLINHALSVRARETAAENNRYARDADRAVFLGMATIMRTEAERIRAHAEKFGLATKNLDYYFAEAERLTM